MSFIRGDTRRKPHRNLGLGDDIRKNTQRNIAEMSHNLGSSVRILGFERGVRFGKTARARAAKLVVGSGGAFQNPAFLIAKIIDDIVKRNSMISPVRVLSDRIGEVCNLPDNGDQMRSVAGILIKKYRYVSKTLSDLYVALRHRELTDGECEDVLYAAARISPDDRKAADAGYLKILLDGGEDAKGLISYDDKPASDEQE